MPGTTPSGSSAPRITLDYLADRCTTRMVMHGVASVALVAIAMFLIWSGPGRPWGSLIVLIAGALAISRVWMLPSRLLSPVPTDSATDPEAAGQELINLAGKTIVTLQVPTIVGLVTSIIVVGWQPIVVGSLITIAGFTFVGPSRTRLAIWRDRMEEGGGKTGL